MGVKDKQNYILKQEDKRPLDYIKVNILENLREKAASRRYKLYMRTYMVVNNINYSSYPAHEYKDALHECNTSCCLSGLIPLVAPEYTLDYRFLKKGKKVAGKPVPNLIWFEKIAEDVLGITPESKKTDTRLGERRRLWNFLFEGGWDSDIKRAIRRLTFVIENRRPPKMSEIWDRKKYDWKPKIKE